MRLRASSLVPMAVTLTLGAGVSAASAASLYTSAAHTTLVPISATWSASVTAPGLRLTSGTATINNCAASTLNLSLTTNTGGTVIGTVNSGLFSTCNLPWTFTGAWRLDVTGSSTMAATKTVFASASLTGWATDWAGGLMHGNLTTGVSVSQGTTSGTGLCVDLANAGTVTHPLTSQGKFDGSYCFTGTAANWSLT